MKTHPGGGPPKPGGGGGKGIPGGKPGGLKPGGGPAIPGGGNGIGGRANEDGPTKSGMYEFRPGTVSEGETYSRASFPCPALQAYLALVPFAAKIRRFNFLFKGVFFFWIPNSPHSFYLHPRLAGDPQH